MYEYVRHVIYSIQRQHFNHQHEYSRKLMYVSSVNTFVRAAKNVKLRICSERYINIDRNEGLGQV